MLASRTLPEGFNPAHVSGLTAWYKASTGVTLGGTPLATGTTPPVVTIAATDGAQPTASALRIEITTGGARGTALFKWSVNDGTTFEATGVATAATVVLASANITVTFPVGTYATDNVYRATVSQWNDRTGNALNLTQATASRQPVMVPRSSVAMNKPCILFDGSNDGLQSVTVSAEAQPNALFVVFRCISAAAIYEGVVDGVTAGARNCLLVHSTGPKVSMYAGTTVQDGVVSSLTDPMVATIEFNGAASILRQNGTTLTTANPGAQGFDGITVGAFYDLSGPTNIEAYEVIVYTTIPSAADRARVEQYLGREYGITVA